MVSNAAVACPVSDGVSCDGRSHAAGTASGPKLTPRLVFGPLRYLLAFALTCGGGWLLLHRVNFSVVGHTVVHASPPLLIPIVALCLLRYWLRAVRWRVLVRHIRLVSVAHSFDRVILSQAAERILPFQLGYLVTVQVTSVKFQIWRFQLFGTDLMESMMDGLIFALFLALAVSTLSVGRAFTGLTALMLAGTTGGFALTWWATRKPGGRIVPLHWPLARFLQRFLQGLHTIQDVRRLLSVFGLTAVIWGTEAILYWVAGLALGLHVNPLVYVFLVSASNIGGSVPFIQSAVGFVFVAQQALMAVGQSLGFATAYALSIEAALILPILICGPAAAYQLRLRFRDLVPQDVLSS